VSFCSVINCMDGRVQEPVHKFVRERFGDLYPDTITEAGPNGILAHPEEKQLTESIFNRVSISVKKHHSTKIAVVGHHDCLGNPGPKDVQNSHTEEAVKLLKQWFPGMEVIGLWVDENWQVHEIC